MAVRSHTVKTLTDALQSRLDSEAAQADDTAAVRITFDQRFIDHLQQELDRGKNTVDLMPLSIKSDKLYTVVIADAREGV